MGFIVKNTTIKGVLDWFCPDACLSCGRVGRNLCNCCKKYIKRMSEEELKKYRIAIDEIVKKWEESDEMGEILDNLWVVGERDGVMKQMVHRYKFKGARFMSWELAELMSEVIPCLNEEMVIVSLPTIERHIRERSFDHAGRLAEDLAKMRGWKREKLLERWENRVQMGADAVTRKKQAQKAYRIKEGVKIDAGKSYLLLDDVLTTGASIASGAFQLRRAGAKKVYAIVILVEK